MGADAMQKVSRKEFFAAVGDKDVHPQIQPGPWPYTSLWRLQSEPGRPVIGKSVVCDEGGVLNTVYFLEKPPSRGK